MIDIGCTALLTHSSIVREDRSTCPTYGFPSCIDIDPFFSRWAVRYFSQIATCCDSIEFHTVFHCTILARIADSLLEDLLENASDSTLCRREARILHCVRKESRGQSIDTISDEDDTDEDDEFAHVFLDRD